MVDAIIDRIKAKIEAFEAWSARKEKQKLRFSLPVSEQKRPESSGSVWPGTISVGRAHTGQKVVFPPG
jgi:sulfate adenylyltransferase subunit 1 (EFTu-like GTPase family)